MRAERHDHARLPEVDGDTPKRQNFKRYPIGFFHIDIATMEGKIHQVVPYRIHTILTDNHIQCAEQPRNRNTASSRPMRFDMICEANGIEHRLTKPNHPWTNGQVKRMNRTIKAELIWRHPWETRRKAEMAIFEDINGFTIRAADTQH